MMPPKKSKAARGHSDESSTAPETTPRKKRATTDVDENDIVEGKRKRTVPIADQQLKDWLEEHLEEREETKISKSDVYSQYLDSSVVAASIAVEQHVFYRELKSKFSKGFGVKEGSPLHDVIKEKKVRKKVVKVQAESLRLKMKDIIENAIREHGNPKKGVKFYVLKNTIAGKYPALRIDLRPGVLKNSLAKGVRYGHFILVRGIGACGLYRVPPAEGEEEEEEEAAKEPEKKEEENGDGEGEKKEGEGESKAEDGDKENIENTEESAEKNEEEDSGKRKTRGSSKPKAKAKKKTARKGAKKDAKEKKKYRSFVVHSDPQRIEDCFQLALTFMSEPKMASFTKMKKYFTDYYPDVNIERLKKAVSAGEENGFWQQTTGQGSSGTYELTLEELDPSTDDNMNSKIANAIMACNEPKQASAIAIKQYIMDYHPDFKLNDKPHLYKRALERAINKSLIRQISGIGATGSFQLAKSFVPTPTQLQGEDDEDYYNQSSDEDDDDDDDEDKEYIEEMLQEYRDKYVPRPTKRRGQGRQGAVGIAPCYTSLAPLASSRRRRR